MFKPPKIKMIPIHFNLDTDRDKVLDHKDCRPFNPKKQHTRPSKTMRKRLDNIELYVTDKPLIEDEDIEPYHILEAKKHAPKAQRELYATIKRYPSVVGEMERQQPKDVVYSSVPGGSFAQDESIFVRAPQTIKKTKKQRKILKRYGTPEDDREQYERLWSGFPTEGEPAIVQEKKRTSSRANILLHELHHLQQQKGLKELSKEEYEEWMEKERKYHRELRLSQHEREAIEYSMKKLEERRRKGKKPTGEEITETLDLD